jgi:hypothetical protein
LQAKDNNCPLALRAMAMIMRSWFTGQAGEECDKEVEADSDDQDIEMQDKEQVAVALPSKKGAKRNAAVLIAEQPQADLQPPPAKQAHLQVI